MVASDGYKPSVASWNPSPNENLLISELLINETLTWTIVGANGHASFMAQKPKLLSKSPALTERPLKKLTTTKNGESKEETNFLRERLWKFNKTFSTIKANGLPYHIKSRGICQDQPSRIINSTTTNSGINNSNNNNNKNNNKNKNNNITNVLPRQVRKPPVEDAYDYAYMTTVQTRSQCSSTKNSKKSETTKPSAIKVEPTRLGTETETVPEYNIEEFPIRIASSHETAKLLIRS